ncbi:hypothetical protein [Halobellus rarus]|uniref:Uncharacterized protein n=1 Tax=Halobellus rarus TaxID=1126237 RepID=A0ABD6CPA4_9EURY|nr:hypothetical protein [Halobellus rarus]
MNSQLQRQTLDELIHKGRYLYPTDVVNIIERFHSVEGPGVPRAVITAYVDEFIRRLGPRAPFSQDRFARLLDGRVADLDMWLPHTIYEVAPGRVSVFPPTWHRLLAGVHDPAQYVGVIGEDLAAAKGVGTGESLPPVPKQVLIDAMMVLGGLDRRTAGGFIKQARLNGRLVVEPFQNPNASVWLPTPNSGHSKPQQLNRPDRPLPDDPNDTRRDSASIRPKYRR